ncbi:hypothetical protein NMG60_11000439 [Bertholletia excelsa]
MSYAVVAPPTSLPASRSSTKHHPIQRASAKAKTSQRRSTGGRAPPGFGGESSNEPRWRCVEGCGACCKLNKGPSFATPEEIFEDPSDVQLYRSLIGPDGWCIHYDKDSRKCSIYSDRPYFCRVEAEIFRTLYGIDKKKFNKEACSCCRDTIKSVYGSNSEELDKFNREIRRSTSA